MAFATSNGKTQTSLADINITPLVDVVLVLLVIFMITAPVLQSGIEVNIPKTRTVKEITEQRLVVTIEAWPSRSWMTSSGTPRITAGRSSCLCSLSASYFEWPIWNHSQAARLALSVRTALFRMTVLHEGRAMELDRGPVNERKSPPCGVLKGSPSDRTNRRPK